MRAICADCDKEVDCTVNGHCSECNSKSTLVPEVRNLVSSEDVVVKYNELVQILRDAEWKREAGSNAGLFLLIARLHQEQGLALGQYLENAISMWTLNAQIVQQETKAQNN